MSLEQILQYNVEQVRLLEDFFRQQNGLKIRLDKEYASLTSKLKKCQYDDDIRNSEDSISSQLIALKECVEEYKAHVLRFEHLNISNTQEYNNFVKELTKDEQTTFDSILLTCRRLEFGNALGQCQNRGFYQVGTNQLIIERQKQLLML
jgi:hypothetical protein